MNKLEKKEFFIILFGIILNLFFANHDLKKYDIIYTDYKGSSYNQMLGSDLIDTWELAAQIKDQLKNNNNYLDAIPAYERFYLPAIIVGFYYHILNKEIYGSYKENNNEKIILVDNSKSGLLIFQILLYYFSIILFYTAYKNKFNPKYNLILLIFICFEPTITQWHYSFWSESIFISLMFFVFYILIASPTNIIINFFVGIIVAIMFAQRAIAFLYILPIIFYYLIYFKKNLKPLLFLVVGYCFVISFIIFNNHDKSGAYYLISSKHQFYSYYHYFASRIYADTNSITGDKSEKILNAEETRWRLENNIPLDLENKINFSSNSDAFNKEESYADELLKNIKYRNQKFLEIVLDNPLYVAQFFIKRVALMCNFSPTWVKQSYENDKTHPQAISNPEIYYNRNLVRNLIYTLLMMLFIGMGLIRYLRDIFKSKKLLKYDKFLLFHISSVLYFILISGLWGNPKYFTPCILSLSIFFAKGLFEFIFIFKIRAKTKLKPKI